MRFHDLDALRAFAMSLGVVLHGALFLVSTGDWPVKDEWVHMVKDSNNPYAFMILIIHGFRMQVFFFLSGFFTAMLWRSRGWRRLASHRLQRVGVPLLLGMVTIIPINTWIFEGRDFNPLSEWILAWLGGFDHLWFLWYLLWMVGAFLALVRVGIKFDHQIWWILIPLTIVPMYFMEEVIFGADTLPTISQVIPSLNLLAYYGTFFFFGAFFFQKGFKIHSWWASLMLPALLFALPGSLILLYPEEFLEITPDWAPLGATVLQTIYSWLMCFSLMGLFRWVAHKEKYWIRYMSDASYWIYLWHLPLIVLGQMVLVNWSVSPHLKFFLLCLIVLSILLVTYQTAVRYTAVGTMLNGPRRRIKHLSD